jgi:hypothetical protein
MKIKFIASEKTKEFQKNEVLEGFYSPSPTPKPLICITNSFGDIYAYPAEWFDIVDEESGNDRNTKQW